MCFVKRASAQALVTFHALSRGHQHRLLSLSMLCQEGISTGSCHFPCFVKRASAKARAAPWQVGFTEGNIRALCDVGRTTKKQTVGYIGQKGIGFKSVFKITDAPQIHSRGFHVCFDLVQHSALGYVLPTWVEEDSATDIASISKLGSQSSATKVLLPFKQVCCLSFSSVVAPCPAVACSW